MKEKITKILQDIRPEYDFLGDEDFIEAGMLDSFDVLTLVTELENAFGVCISGDEILPENFASVEVICELVSKSKKKA
ncbi:MAG: acyl carrier protein [Campylobacter sp.]|nr:acyl carrier protein [Campylobacter sp.]